MSDTGNDNPFADDDDIDKTVVQSAPGPPAPEAAPARAPGGSPDPPQADRSQSPAPRAPAAPRQQPAQQSRDRSGGAQAARPTDAAEGGDAWERADAADFTGGSVNRLADAAAPLLALVTWCRDLDHHPDPDGLLGRAIAQVRAFENAAMASGYTPEQIRSARYALCATMDDVVLATPWGGQSAWSHRGLISTVHKETLSGERFFDLLEYLLNRPQEHLEELKLFYICLALGFEGKYRIQPRGSNELNRIRDRLYRVIREYDPEGDPDLSPSWHGLNQGHRPLGAVIPAWLPPVGMLCALLVGAGVLWADLRGDVRGTVASLLSAGDGGEPLALSQLDPPEPIPTPEPADPAPEVDPLPEGEPETTAFERISDALEAEMTQDRVAVLDDNGQVTVRIEVPDQFELGSTTPTSLLDDIMIRIGDTMDAETGQITVVGHTDSLPIRSGPYPDNAALSRARAEAGAAILADRLEDPDRVAFQGRGDTDPIASNDTEEGRARNRRLEVVLDTDGSEAP